MSKRRTAKRKAPVLGSHQKCWVWGRNAVVEILRAAKWPVLELYLEESLPSGELRQAREAARQLGVAALVESSEELERRCRSAEHQGYVAKMPPFPYDDADHILECCPPQPLYVLLDSIQDPFNFGAILRSAEILGVNAVFIGESSQVGVTSLVARSSAGAVNYVPIARVPDLIQLATRLRDSGIQLAAASEKAERKAFDLDWRLATALVIGNEGTGIRPELLAACDAQIRIPQSGHVAALNAAVSAGILFYEAQRQRMSGEDRGLRIEDRDRE
jgi:23S rRNA (guanosine2251-2'-O)-methyltransferase